MKTARVLYPFTPRFPDEIEVSFNNVVTVVSEESDAGKEWIEAEFNGKCGKIPRAFVESIHLNGVDATVLYDYVPEEDSGQFLRLEKNDTIMLLSYDHTGWDIGYSAKTSQVGVIPRNYVKIVNPSTLEDIKELFFMEDMALVQILCNTIDTSSCESLSKDLTLFFGRFNETFTFFQTMIKQEVHNTINEGTLFRKNNLTSYSLTAYSRFIGQSYLKKTLVPLISSIATSPHSCEIDPHRVDKDELVENIQNLRKLCQFFFHKIMESIPDAPKGLKYLCHLLKTIVFERFPAARRRVIGGFYFLRFICPAVVSPEGFGVIDKIDPKTRRGLILISKIIQTLSNGVEFGKKEEYMIPMNSFINENLENAHWVLDKLSFPDLDSETEKVPALKDEEYKQLIKRLHSQLYSSIHKIENEIKQRATSLSPNFLDRVMSTIIAFGPPTLRPNSILSPNNSSANINNNNNNNANNNSNNNNVNNNNNNNQNGGQKDLEMGDKKHKEDKKHKDDKKSHEKKIREDKKNKVKKKSEFPFPEGSILAEGYALRKTKGNFNQIQWVKKYYSLFSISAKLYVSNSQEDLRENKFIGFIDLLPAFSTSLIGKCKNPPGWEVRLVTNAEHNLIFPTEDEMRTWVSYFDRRLSEILLPEQALKRKEDLIMGMESKLAKHQADIDATKQRLANKAEGEDKSADEKHFEELMVIFNDLQRNLDKVKRDRDQQIQSNLKNPNLTQ